MFKSVTDVLNEVTQNFVNYLPLIFPIFGFIGFIGNIFTYLQPNLRSNTCCIYSICGSIFDIIALYLSLFPFFLTRKFGIPTSWRISHFLCKLGLFLLVFIPGASVNFLLMAIIDRFAATCSLTSPIRRLNQLKMVPLMIAITIIITILSSLFAPLLYYFNSSSVCVVVQATLYTVFYIIFIGFIPPILMLIFVLLTYRNIRQSRRRVGATSNTLNIRQTRNHFITMIFVQIGVTAFLTSQWIIMYGYARVIATGLTSADAISITNFAQTLSLYCFYLNNVKSFYVSMLTSDVFRKTFIKGLIGLLPRYIQQMLHRFEAEGTIVTVTRQKRRDMTQR